MERILALLQWTGLALLALGAMALWAGSIPETNFIDRPLSRECQCTPCTEKCLGGTCRPRERGEGRLPPSAISGQSVLEETLRAPLGSRAPRGAGDSAASKKEWDKGCLPADYWRVHDHLPSRGRITIPDRSYACHNPLRGGSPALFTSIRAGDVRGPAVFRSRV